MPNPQNTPAPKLVQCATPWSMIGYPAKAKEWALEKKMLAMKEAGFDGIAAIVNPEIASIAGRLGLVMMGGFDGSNVPAARRLILAQQALGVYYLNVQLLDHDTPPQIAAKLAVQLIKLSEEIGVAVHIETHRDTATETPEKFEEIARLFRRATGKLMPVTWDHSHFAVSKHVLPQAYVERLLAWPKLIQNSNVFHLRPFNSQHCQVPVTDGRGRLSAEFKDYLAFVEELFALWLRGSRPRNELWVCPELGLSHGYHVSVNPPVWPDAVRARREYAGAWQRALRRAA